MRHLAVYMMLVLGGNENPTKEDVTTALKTVGIDSDSEQLDRLFAELEGKNINDLIEEGLPKLASFGGGGGGGGASATVEASGDAPAEKEAVKEEEADIDGAMDMFGSDY